ncbi:MAG: DNA gyrase/topoisomerase IV subunit A, partial [Bacteroidaceae bacterium]|nr:DNA gyrase/topoisomerase IV subunit A [Bacteroidaceae bacterium]
ELLLLNETGYPRISVTMGGTDSFRDPLEVDAEEFIGVKSFKAKGKRITTLAVAEVTELEPLRFPQENTTADETAKEADDTVTSDTDDEKSQQDVADEMTGQLHLFD